METKTHQKIHKWTTDQLEKRFKEKTHCLQVQAQFSRELVGGLPATREGVENFVRYQMQSRSPIPVKEQADLVDKILDEEIGDRDTTPELGDLNEKVVGQVNVLRRDAHGTWVGDWMVKAMLKSTASRLNLWIQKRGLKGDMSECSRVYAINGSLQDKKHSEKIYVRSEDGKGSPEVFWQQFMGRISGPSGSASIVTNAECLRPGGLIEFAYFFLGEKMTSEEAADILSICGHVGLGSSRAMERGKLIILSAQFIEPEEGYRKVKAAAVEEKKKGKAA